MTDSEAGERRVRIFVSSPSDVMAERERVDRVVARLNAGLRGAVVLETVRWEQSYYSAASTFQAQIDDPAACQIVVAIFWQRLGTPLPPDFERMPGGAAYPSGTVYEVMKAIEASKASADGLPDVLVYRKLADVVIAMADRERYRLAHEQRELFMAFWDDWFMTRSGQFKAAFNTFATTDEFDANLESHLREWLADRGFLAPTVRRPIAQFGSPYKGLEAFGPDDEDLLFGRERDIQRALARLGRSAGTAGAALFLIGESGSGKSSLARAGVAPRILRGGLGGDVDGWRYAEMRPGADPVRALAEALFAPHALPELAQGDFSSPASLATLLALGPAAGVAPVLRALERASTAAQGGASVAPATRIDLLLVVDQLEELIGGTAQAEASAAFCRLLAALVGSGRVALVATLRSDAYAAVAALPDLLALKEAGETLDVLPPGAAAVAEAVQRPAALAGLTFEPDAASGVTLDEMLLADVQGEKALPLLQFVLSQLFDAMVRRLTDKGLAPASAGPDDLVLRVEDYRAIGGLRGAVAASADAALRTLSFDPQDALRDLLRQLVSSVGDGPSARPALRDVDLAMDEGVPGRSALVDALVAARILVAGTRGEGRVSLRIAHEAVLTNWPRAAAILAADQRFLRVRAEVEAAHARWSRHASAGRAAADGFLIPSGVPLAEAEDMLAADRGSLSPALAGFIAQSGQRARRKQRLVAAAAAVFAVTAVVAAGAAFMAVSAQREAGRNAELAQANAREAEANRDRAVKRLHQMADQTESFVLNTVQTLKNRAGVTSEAVAALLAEADRQLAELGAIDPDDAYIRMVDGKTAVLMADNFLALGKVAEAEVSASRCLDAVIGVPPEKRSVAEAHVLALCLGSASRVVLEKGDLPKAIAYAAKAAQAAKALHEAFPDDPLYARNRAVTAIALADLRLAEGDGAAAAAAYAEALAVRRALAAARPGDDAVAEDLALALDRVSKVELQRQRTAEALAAATEALAIGRRLAEASPGNMVRQLNLAAGLEKASLARSATGDAAGAVEAMTESVAVRRRLVVLDPSRLDLETMLVRGLNILGIQLARAGRAVEAAAVYRETLDRARAAAIRNPVPDVRRDLSIALNKMAAIELAAGNGEAAKALARESLALARALADAAPGPRGQLDLATSHLTLGDAGEETRTHYAAALAIYESLQTQGLLPGALSEAPANLRRTLASLPSP